MMNCDGCIASASEVPCLRRIRGELAIGAHLRATDLYAVGSFDPDHDAVMRIGGEAPGGGPILSVGISARFEYGFPPPRIVNSAVVLKSQRERRMVLSGMLVPVSPFQDAGRKMTPSSGSPTVTKRHSAMTSLRASATIMVLRVPIRLSAVRARYHNASALSF